MITLQDIFLFDFGMGVDENGRFNVLSRPASGQVRREVADLGIASGQKSSPMSSS